MNINKLQVNNKFKDDIINHTEFNKIQLPKHLDGIIGYVTFLNTNTLVANVENKKYYKKKKATNLPTFFDINSICVSNLLSSTATPSIGKMFSKSLTRMAHNMCIFETKEKKCYYGIGGRFDKTQPERWKTFNITEDKGLYLIKKDKLDGKEWNIMNEGNPVIGKDTVSKFRKPASYDSQISCIYSHILNKYILAVRNNVGREKRFFSMLYSDDCLKWSDFYIPTINPSYNEKSGDQYYSVILHEIIPIKVILACVLFYNKNTKIYGIKLLITRDTKSWSDAGIIFSLPTGIMPRNKYIRPKIHCGGITSDKSGKITFSFYKYKETNNIEYFNKTYFWNELFNTI